MNGDTHHSAAEAGNEGRGRHATAPTRLPWEGWRDVLWRVYGELAADRVLLVAAGVTFYMLLAMVPGLTALVSVYGLVADASTVSNHVTALGGVLPGGATEILSDQLERLAEQNSGGLGLALLVSLAISLWSTNAGVKALFDAMNVAYDETEKRSFVKLNLVSLAFTLGALLAAVLLIAVSVALPVVMNFVDLGAALNWLVTLAGYAVVLVVMAAGIAALHRYGPSRRRARWRWVSVGSGLTVVVVLGFSILFSWYVANFGSYDATYGSLGAIIGFMTWIWISMVIVLVGAELNSEIEHQVVVDTTVGPDRPMGQRGAAKADTVGKTHDGKSWQAGEREPHSSNVRATEPPGQGGHRSPASVLFGAAALAAFAYALLGRRASDHDAPAE